MNKKISLLLILFILSVCGCQKSPITSGIVSFENGREFFPYKNGYSWTYNYSGFQPYGNLGIIIQGLKFNFTGVTTFRGNEVHIQKNIATVSSEGTIKSITIAEVLYSITDSQVIYYGNINQPDPEKSIILAFPLEVGSIWAANSNQNSTIISKENVSVPAGAFNDCFKIRTGDSASGIMTDSWYAKNVGLVKTTIMDRNGSIKVTGELVSKNF